MNKSLALQHTRGVPLRNLCLLCAALRELGALSPRRAVLLAGRDLGLPQFRSVERTGGVPTRVRHHEYALRELELFHTDGPLCSLTAKGARLAQLATSFDAQPMYSDAEKADVSLPEPVRAELREVLCSSSYVRYWWLRYFMATEEFSVADLVHRGKDVIVELVPPARRDRGAAHYGTGNRDSGYRVHSVYPQRASLRLDESGRREIHEGLRQWCLRVDLVSEVTGWEAVFDTEEEYLTKLESHDGRRDRVYPVCRGVHKTSSIADFEALLSDVRARMGGKTRVRIPELVMDLALHQHMSRRDIDVLFRRLYREKRAQYFFESASRQIITQPSNPYPLEAYVRIDGAWRSSIVFADSLEHDR